MHINCINNGMGAPSVSMLVLAGMGKIGARLSISADTGSELDCLWSNGNRTTAKEYWQTIIKPLAAKLNIDAVFVRTLDKHKKPLIPITERLLKGETAGVPLFGSNGGRLRQGCTEKYKVRAIRQELRRHGAKTATSYLGLTMDEVHRMKQHNDVLWHDVDWPLIHLRMYKASCRALLEEREIPYLLSTECDLCPHKNLSRWNNSNAETIAIAEKAESAMSGTMWLTPQRIPIKSAIENMKAAKPTNTLFDLCDSGYCFT